MVTVQVCKDFWSTQEACADVSIFYFQGIVVERAALLGTSEGGVSASLTRAVRVGSQGTDSGSALHRAVNTVYFKSRDIPAGFLRLKDIMLKTQRKCKIKNTENLAKISKLNVKIHFNHPMV